jgi:ABC-type nickel/cobalt efflux system permease component RcnA
MNRRLIVASFGVPAALALFVVLPAGPAAAAPGPVRHPLGNFSINQYLGLTLRPDRVDATAVVDAAEIPTLQDRSTVDSNGDGTVSDAERTAYAGTRCREVAGAAVARVGDQSPSWAVTQSSFTYDEGSGGLDVSRLVCQLSAQARVDGRVTMTVSNRFLANRIGWREMTATGEGVRLVDSPLPAVSVTDELRSYPEDLLSSALDVRSATLVAEPGSSSGAGDAGVVVRPGTDPVSRWMASLERRFEDLVGGSALTPAVGVLTVLLAVLLGAGHAALPGHGKTILAAYLAGRRGRPRDAVAVAGTVTLTHTGGVLGLGLLLTAGAAVAGEAVIGYLGLVSGVLVLGVGTGMLVGALRRRRAGGHHHGHHDHGHRHSHWHHADAHTHGQDAHDSHAHDSHAHCPTHGHAGTHSHAQAGDPPDQDGSGRRARRGERLGIAGIGLAGGLVPSPSALVVLLAAIGLGRTGFGVLLVVAYGVGMAATLTGAGLLLLAVQRRVTAATAGRLSSRLNRIVSRLQAATPTATAALVTLVGMGLAVRAAATVL